MFAMTYRMMGALLLDRMTYESVEVERSTGRQAVVVVLLSSLAAGIGAAGWAGPQPVNLVTTAAIALITFELTHGYHPRKLLITALAVIWGSRLAVHIGWRNHGKGEDFRYQAMRRRIGDRFALVSLFVVFGLQGLLMWVIFAIWAREIGPRVMIASITDPSESCRSTGLSHFLVSNTARWLMYPASFHQSTLTRYLGR